MIKVLCVGKIKEAFFREAILEYQKRLQKYVKLEIVEVMDVNAISIDITLEKERDLLLRHIHDKDYVISLQIEGKEISSIDFSNMIDNLTMHYSNLVFVVGGSYGLHEDIKRRSNFSLSFSSMTFPHQMFRVMLLEQIYRSYKIIKNENYHK